MALGTCCGCFNFRQGSIVSLGLGLVVGLLIVFFFIFLCFDPVSITQAIVREKLLGNTAVGIFIFCSVVPIASMVALTNMNFTSGGATKVIAFLTFFVGVMWFVFGSMLARRLNNGYRSFVPSGIMFKKYAQNPEGNTALMGAGMVAAVTLDSMAIRIMMDVLPFPLNYFYYMGIYPIIPFLAFGLLPAVFTWMSLGSIMSLAAVMDAGGDGTEYVEAKKIHWFYSLSASDRDRVREGSDLDGEADSSDDSDSDEEAGLVKKAPKRVAVA